MQAKLVTSVTLFSVIVFAQSNNFNVDFAEESKVLNEIEGFVTSLEANPTFQAEVAALIIALPSSVIQEGEQDPEALIAQLGASGRVPAWVSAIPTPLIESLETLAAKPIKAVGDEEAYLDQLALASDVAPAISTLRTAVPTSVQQAFASDPAAFLENIVTATALPPWVTDIPAPLQSDIGSVVNEALSIIDTDLGGDAAGTIVMASSPVILSSGYAKATGTGAVVGYNGTNGGPAGTPLAFMGAAAPTKKRTAAIGWIVLMVGAGVVCNM